MIKADSSLADVCFVVCTALEQVGTRAVLSGGSAAAIYAPERYQSYDADFVITFGGGAEAAKAIATLGFTLTNGVYQHHVSKYTLDFPAGPLAIGDEIVTVYQRLQRDAFVLYILERTDCIRDRLAAFYFWADRSSLVTALHVARSGPHDLEIIKQWSLRNGMIEKFDEFVAAIRQK